VYRIAREHGIKGSVRNTPAGVTIMAAGEGDQVLAFLKDIKDRAPAAARIDELDVLASDPFETSGFVIEASGLQGDSSVLVSPDLATCPDCVAELFEKSDRRFAYAFTNCTNCGPRFTIIRDTPYDRPATSMALFVMCPECRAEYENPSDRRFHAQPNACPVCGPKLSLVDAKGKVVQGDPMVEAARLLKEGKIVAVKGLGGFQLACDATSDEAVTGLRNRKKRYGKPLAVMVSDLRKVAEICEAGPEERKLLQSPAAPIVLLKEKKDSPLSSHVAYGLDHQGLFLPYTPVHHLLLAETGLPLVMTSGNVSEEPIVIDNDEARRKLKGIADCFLTHDRDILVRYDDSVTRVFEGREYPVRRARGYAPYPLKVKPASSVEVLAVGPELKNTFCLLRGEEAFVGQHIGDMESAEEAAHFDEALAAMKRLFSLRPDVIAHDLHPDYQTTQMARGMDLPLVGVQHHHAHIASCMADNMMTEPVIGVAFDGTGYGEDGTVWGGEFLLCDGPQYKRVAHLTQYPMPGADACINRIYRMAAGVLSGVFDDIDAAIETVEGLFNVSSDELDSLRFQLEKGVNAPMTSSAGRMFDTVAALAGVRSEAQYDGQAACELEAVALEDDRPYDYTLVRSNEPWVIDTRPLFECILADVADGVEAGVIAGRFHATMAGAVAMVCAELSRATGITSVALSGGVFQNMNLLRRVVKGLRARKMEPLLHRRVPCNDGGVSLGQAMVAAGVREIIQR
jgi:hydrogenase maturation protein HypF